MKKNRYIAEGIGTFFLVFAGCGAIIVDDIYDGIITHVGVSLVFGLIVMTMIYAVGNISGAHLNPAVTLGFLFAKRLDLRLLIPYITSQISGAILACLILRILFPEHESLGATLPSVDLIRAFIIEIILSFLLMFVILNVSTEHMEKGIMAGVAVGGTITLEALLAGPLTGASMNPARSLAPALVSGYFNFKEVWIYLLAPIIGTFLAHPTCQWIQGDECCPQDLDSRA